MGPSIVEAVCSYQLVEGEELCRRLEILCASPSDCSTLHTC